jgi:hypothetical protein
MKELSVKEIKFIENYLALGGLDVGKAAIAAGYGEKNASSSGNRILKRDRVKEKLKEFRKQIEANAGNSRDKMMRDLEKVIEEARAGDYPNYTAILKAMDMKCKMLGYYNPEVQQVNNYDVTIRVLESKSLASVGGI